jgi:hypothetical protein
MRAAVQPHYTARLECLHSWSSLWQHWLHDGSSSSSSPWLLTIFSPSPIHLLVSELALMLKKVAWMLLAMALPISVLPVPGGPKSSRPLGGALAPAAQGQTTVLSVSQRTSGGHIHLAICIQQHGVEDAHEDAMPLPITNP